MALRFDVLTLFPELFSAFLAESIPGRARREGLFSVHFTNFRDFTTDRHRSVDDRPYGGGPGMVLKPEPVFEAVESVLADPSISAETSAPGDTRKILLCPQGEKLTQARLREWSGASRIVLVCGHYEGFDQRIVDGLGFEPVSIGDYVLSGGELPAMVLIDGICRLLPGALGHPESASHESFEDGLLDHPQYTRPPEYRGMRVPEVLLSGNHEEIARWRHERALERTRARRADLLAADMEWTTKSPEIATSAREARRSPQGARS